ncbi:MAG: DNA double-strand break repair nuclease NurA [Dehalococcoidia bacterium]
MDGSHIDVDRHAPARCFVLNLGWSAIFYGADLAPELDSCAELQPSSASLVERDEQDASGEHELRGETLSLLRGVRELAQLAALAERLPPDLPQVLLLDGNLGLWNVSRGAISRRMRDRFIYEEGGLLPALNAARRLAEERTLACGAYTSAPGTAEVVHALRAGVCPMDEPVCTRCPGLGRPLRPCDDVGLTTDAELFEALLAPGERSAVFQATSRAFLRTDQPRTPPWYEQEGHTIAFFYLRLADEVARVETPLWLAQRPERVGLLHAALLDQCEKGPGYPVALQEAHEQAVITTVDRRSFAALLERELERAGTAFAGTAKSRSKRVRTI